MPTAIWIVQLNTAQTEFKARYKLETFGQINNTFQDFMLESIRILDHLLRVPSKSSTGYLKMRKSHDKPGKNMNKGLFWYFLPEPQDFLYIMSAIQHS